MKMNRPKTKKIVTMFWPRSLSTAAAVIVVKHTKCIRLDANVISKESTNTHIKCAMPTVE